MRPTPQVLLTAVAVLAYGCDSMPTDLALPDAFQAAIADGGHGGNVHFYFLPPMAAATSYGGVFDPAAEPTVDVCRLEGGVCGPTVASFSTTEGSGSELIRVDLEDEHYIVNWHTRGSGVQAGETYRVSVTVEGTELGFADVKVVGSGRDLRGVDATAYVGLVAGRTLPIKFRVEEGAVPCPTEVLVDANALTLLVRSGVHAHPAQGRYGGTSILYGGGLVYGTSADSMVLGYNSRLGTTDFAPQEVCPAGTSPARTVAHLAVKPGVPAPGAVAVRQETYAYTDAANDDYVLLRFRFTNAGSTAVTNLHAAYLADFDLLFDGNAATDVARYNLLYAGAEAGEGLDGYPQLVGIVPWVPTAVAAQYVGWVSFSPDPAKRDPTTPAGWWALLSGGVRPATVGWPSSEGLDIRQLVGFGPVTLAPGESVVMSFALVGGADRATFEANALAAQSRASSLGF